MKKFIIAALGVALAGMGVNAYAVTSTPASTALTPTLQITGNCTVTLANTNTALRSPPSASTTLLTAEIGTVAVQDCTNDYWLGADGGANQAVAGTNPRRLKSATPVMAGPTDAFIAYTLDIAGGTPAITPVVDWGSSGMLAAFDPAATGSAVHQTANTTGALDTYLITANFTVLTSALNPAEVYADTVNVRVDF